MCQIKLIDRWGAQLLGNVTSVDQLRTSILLIFRYSFRSWNHLKLLFSSLRSHLIICSTDFKTVFFIISVIAIFPWVVWFLISSWKFSPNYFFEVWNMFFLNYRRSCIRFLVKLSSRTSLVLLFYSHLHAYFVIEDHSVLILHVFR